MTQDDLPVTDVPLIAAPEHSSPDTFAVRGFQKGYDPRRNVAGRIKKKPTVWDETQKLASQAKHRKAIARAAVQTMELPHSVAGSRERALYHDRDIGKVVQPYIIDIGESRADALDSRLAQLLGQTVDGEARLLDDNVSESDARQTPHADD